MNMLEEYSERWIQTLERRKSRVPYSFIWCLLGLGSALFVFGFVNGVWGYYLEGFVAVGAAVVVFLIEASWRRITELKTFLSEYVEANRFRRVEPAEVELKGSADDALEADDAKVTAKWDFAGVDKSSS
jgi:hypothetical protein